MRRALFFIFLVMASPSHAMLSKIKTAIKNFITEARMPPVHADGPRDYYCGIFKIIAIETPITAYYFPYTSLFINGAALCLLSSAYIREINSDMANRLRQRVNRLFHYDSLSATTLNELMQTDAYGNSDPLSLEEQNTGFLTMALAHYQACRILLLPYDGAKYLTAARISIRHHADTAQALRDLRREEMHDGVQWLATELKESDEEVEKSMSKIE